MSDNLPVVAPRPYAPPAVPQWLAAAMSERWSSLDLTKPDEAILFARAEQEECRDADDLGEAPVDICHVHFKSIPAREVQGELMPGYIRTVVISPDGSMVAFGSSGVVDSLRLFMTIRPDLPWVPPIRAVLARKKLPNGHRYYQLVGIDYGLESKKEVSRGKKT